MILIVGILVAVITVPAAKGSFRGVDRLQLRAGWLMAITMVAQVIMFAFDDGWVPRSIHVGSFLIAASFVALNRSIRGIGWVATGGALNLAAVIANRGVMPASSWAWSASDAPSIPLHEFSNARPVPGANLLALGDIVPFPPLLPGSAPFSVGDVLLIIGFGIIVHHACGARWTLRRPHRDDPAVQYSSRA